MPLHYPGYYKVRQQVFEMDDEQLLDQLDSLYGRTNLPEGYSHEQLLNEALAQVSKNWTDTSSTEYEQSEFWKKIATLRH